MVNFTVNDLPRFSPWPARLLGLEPWPQKRRTPEENVREYEREKWSPLLERARNAGRAVSVEEVDEWMHERVPDGLCSIGDRLELLSARAARERYLSLVESVLRPFLPAPALVELGAGYGSVILRLARRGLGSRTRLVVGEYAASGIELASLLARPESLDVETARCDFASSWVFDAAVPPDAVIFTSYAITCIPKLPADFFRTVAAWQPRAVVHFEPCYEHGDSQTVLGLMRRRYIELNDYNRDLATVLHDQQEQGLVSILAERPAVFGSNPLLAASVLVWRPRQARPELRT